MQDEDAEKVAAVLKAMQEKQDAEENDPSIYVLHSVEPAEEEMARRKAERDRLAAMSPEERAAERKRKQAERLKQYYINHPEAAEKRRKRAREENRNMLHKVSSDKTIRVQTAQRAERDEALAEVVGANSDIADENKDMHSTTIEKAKAGRPKSGKSGSGSNKALKRVSNTLFLSHAMELANLPPVRWNETKNVSQRAEMYFAICIKNDMRPSIVGLALSFGMSRAAFDDFRSGINDVGATPEAFGVIEKAVAVINAQFEDYMLNGLITPVSGIFLLKNDFGYKDTSEQVVTTKHTGSTAEELIADLANFPTQITDVTDDGEDKPKKPGRPPKKK